MSAAGVVIGGLVGAAGGVLAGMLARKHGSVKGPVVKYAPAVAGLGGALIGGGIGAIVTKPSAVLPPGTTPTSLPPPGTPPSPSPSPAPVTSTGPVSGGGVYQLQADTIESQQATGIAVGSPLTIIPPQTGTWQLSPSTAQNWPPANTTVTSQAPTSVLATIVFNQAGSWTLQWLEMDPSTGQAMNPPVTSTIIVTAS
jgi:hypothetical protein